VILGWLCIALGAIGAFLPVLPTTPFLILALWLFNRSSPRFHTMLINNPWFGASLQQWEDTKSITTKTRRRAVVMIIATFALSIYLVQHTWQLQIMLALLCTALLIFIFRIKVQEQPQCQ